MDSQKITLITGGVKSGKSRYALSLAEKSVGKKIFIATAESIDASMTERIRKHREERGDAFTTIEEPINLSAVLKNVPVESGVVVIDCLTLWVNNLFYFCKEDCAQIRSHFDSFLEVLAKTPRVIMVTNEVGLGITPENRLARTFADELGILNQRVAQISSDVILMVAGLPSYIKRNIEMDSLNANLRESNANPREWNSR